MFTASMYFASLGSIINQIYASGRFFILSGRSSFLAGGFLYEFQCLRAMYQNPNSASGKFFLYHFLGT